MTNEINLSSAVESAEVTSPDYPLIASFYTPGTRYETDAEQLINSCKRLGLKYDIRPLHSDADWVNTCARKGKFLLKIWQEHSNPILWIDADAVIHDMPDLLMNTDADFAVHRFEGRYFASGTIYFNRTETAGELLAAWAALCEKSPEVPDQQLLEQAYDTVSAARDIKVLWLPESYTKIYDHLLSKAVIEHYQASRDTGGPGMQAPDEESVENARDSLMKQVSFLRDRHVEKTAERLAEKGVKRIALYSGGRHSIGYWRQPWEWFGIKVIAILDDKPAREYIGGVPVMVPDKLQESVDAIVISTDYMEEKLYRIACDKFPDINIERIYGKRPEPPSREEMIRRFPAEFGISEEDALWLADNRYERHDATLPMLPPERTELHLRRYEAAARLAEGCEVLDLACGTGYGGPILTDQGRAKSVHGIDIDGWAVKYALNRFARGKLIKYSQADVTDTGLPDECADLIASFETVEHISDAVGFIREVTRLLRPGGKLIISTPNDWPLTKYHVHSFTRESFGELLQPHFRSIAWWGQRPGNEPRIPDLPAGMYPLRAGSPKPDFLIAVATKRFS